MDPITPTLVLEAWKVGGIVAALLVILGFVLWLGWKDSRARERRMSAALEKCQDGHTKIATECATALANNTAAVDRLNDSTSALVDVLRDRPCLKDPTPPHGHRHHFPTPRPPTDRRT